ncbi:MAG: hypothetical protein IJE07_13770 [Clostridia bacterium]|nr:hypothetical protein [Clostridia bacterium]
MMTYNYKDGTETISLDAVHQAFGSDLASDAPRTESEKTRFFVVLMALQLMSCCMEEGRLRVIRFLRAGGRW